MDDGALGASDKAPKETSPSSDEFLNNPFLSKSGLRAGWRLLIYAAIVAVLWSGAVLVLRELVRPVRGAFSLEIMILGEATSFAVVFAGAFVMARIERRSVGAYGLPARSAFGKLFGFGCLIGLCEVSILVGLTAAFGGYSLGPLALHGRAIAGWGLLWALCFIFVGLFEEFLFRGYTQYTLGDGIGFWPAAILLSACFALVHRKNPGEDWIGIASVFLTGLVFALALRRTGNLWFAVGMHASFDFGETFLYSVPNSGATFSHHLSNAALHGATWLTGGTVGPEGSVFSFVTLALLALAIHVLFPPQHLDEAKTEKRQPT